MHLTETMLGAIKRWAHFTPTVERVFIFGSYARGNATENSDLNLAIECAQVSGNSLSEIIINRSTWSEELTRAVGVPVDLNSTDNPSAPFRDELKRAGALVYDRTRAAGVRDVARRLASGYLAAAVGHHVATNPHAINLLPPSVHVPESFER